MSIKNVHVRTFLDPNLTCSLSKLVQMDVQMGREVFLSFFLDDKTSAPDVFSSCSFISRTHFETSLVMVSDFGYEIWRHKWLMVKPFLSENACFLNLFQQ